MQEIFCEIASFPVYPSGAMASPKSWAEIAAELRPIAKNTRGTQKKLAIRLNLKDYKITRFLNGTEVPDPVTGMNLAKLLGVDLSEAAGLSNGVVQSLLARVEAGGAGSKERELSGVGAPLVADDVAAGEAALPSVPDEKVYFFHEAWMRKRGWRPADKDRFCCIKLGSSRVASSMLPTIQPRSIILIDRRPNLDKIADRSIWLVADPDEGAAVKRVTLSKPHLILESDNPDPQFRPRIVSLDGLPLQEIARGRVLWWATEAD